MMLNRHVLKRASTYINALAAVLTGIVMYYPSVFPEPYLSRVTIATYAVIALSQFISKGKRDKGSGNVDKN